VRRWVRGGWDGWERDGDGEEDRWFVVDVGDVGVYRPEIPHVSELFNMSVGVAGASLR
jgi:hypothetical protein